MFGAARSHAPTRRARDGPDACVVVARSRLATTHARAPCDRPGPAGLRYAREVEVEIDRVPAALTYPLRRAVLRPHQRIEQLAEPSDEDPDSGTFAAIDRATGDVVATANVRPEPAPFAAAGMAGHASWRLR